MNIQHWFNFWVAVTFVIMYAYLRHIDKRTKP